MKRILIALALLLNACAPAQPAELTPVTVMLDWVPNVNHAGLFVAQERGYFTQAGLTVELIQPGEVYAEQAVASGAADFGISFQEQVTLARADDVPLVSIAAILQHNTSAFASRAGEGLDMPLNWAGRRYGSFGSPFEAPTLQALMDCAGGDFSQLDLVETGFADPLALLSAGQIDLAWIYYGTQGVAAEQQGLQLDLVRMEDYFDCVPDYYTPLLIASEDGLRQQPNVASAFLKAVSRGYAEAARDPDSAAAILLQQSPESGLELLQAQMRWLAPRYQAEAARWGEQRLSVWDGYSHWMAGRGILSAPIDAEAAFSNNYLP